MVISFTKVHLTSIILLNFFKALNVILYHKSMVLDLLLYRYTYIYIYIFKNTRLIDIAKKQV